MHEHDFELLEERTEADGTRRFHVRIKAAGLDRWYIHLSDSDTIRLDGDPLLVGGHDMTSIIGKRVREWLRSNYLEGK